MWGGREDGGRENGGREDGGREDERMRTRCIPKCYSRHAYFMFSLVHVFNMHTQINYHLCISCIQHTTWDMHHTYMVLYIYMTFMYKLIYIHVHGILRAFFLDSNMCNFSLGQQARHARCWFW